MDADADVESADLKIRISRKGLNILTRNFENIFIYTYFIYLVHYLVVWEHIFLILERRLTIFVWLSPLWIHIKTWSFVVMWDRFEKKSWCIYIKNALQKKYNPKSFLKLIRYSHKGTTIWFWGGGGPGTFWK